MSCVVYEYRWSVILSCIKLYVLILSDLSANPICIFFKSLLIFKFLSYSNWYNLLLSIFKAAALFRIWLRSVWQSTTRPEGVWYILTAESVVLTCWPPAPDDRRVSTFKSFSSIFISTSSKVGRIETADVEVWIRPALSVLGTRWTRWTPDSRFSVLYAEGELIKIDPWRRPPKMRRNRLWWWKWKMNN